MVMRYYGGGIGHLSNAPLRQADPLTPSSGEEAPSSGEEAVPADEGDRAERDPARGGVTQDIIMQDKESEVDDSSDEGNDDDEASTDSENYDYHKNGEGDEEEDEGSTCSSDSDSDEEDSSD